nr:MAG TPA: hypothetical protein [Caudoviricetes sp.]
MYITLVLCTPCTSRYLYFIYFYTLYSKFVVL